MVINMFTKEQLQGILISLPKPEVHISKDTRLRTGYKVRLRLNVRAKKDFLLGLQRTLVQYNIESQFKEEEHKSRPFPILRISGVSNLLEVLQLYPENLPDAKGHYEPFSQVVTLVAEGAHLTQEGLDDILMLKGWI
jgi:hypothetical protein